MRAFGNRLKSIFQNIRMPGSPMGSVQIAVRSGPQNDLFFPYADPLALVCLLEELS